MSAATGITADDMKDYFLGWQCRIRQIAMRKGGGRPSSGMCASVYLRGGTMVTDAMITVLVPKEPEESTAFFRFQVQKHKDPKDVYEKGLAYLQATHFQHPQAFNDSPAALFYQESRLAEVLREAGECMLEFAQYSQTFKLLCAVAPLARKDDAFQATLWHNRLFNPALPDAVTVLSFQPDWASAQADPAP